MTVVLDSWAVIGYLENTDPAAMAVGALLEAERPVMSWINLGEVFSVVRRHFGEDAASSTIRDLRSEITMELPSEDRVVAAARMKAEFPLAYADAFAAATAIGLDATLWTGDPELLVTPAPWRWRDLRWTASAGSPADRVEETL